MGAIVIPYWFIVAAIAAAGIFWCGYEIGKDVEQSHAGGLIAVWLVPAALLCFGLLLYVMIWMV
jgi:hypothetical protein